MKQKVSLKNVCILQAVIIIYTLSSIMAKFASGHALLSVRSMMFYGLEIMLLGIYAIAWQQVIKHFELSVAYANRAIALLWSMVWSTVIFQERITVKNMIGVVLVMAGIFIINTEQSEALPAKKKKEMQEKREEGEAHE